MSTGAGHERSSCGGEDRPREDRPQEDLVSEVPVGEDPVAALASRWASRPRQWTGRTSSRRDDEARAAPPEVAWSGPASDRRDPARLATALDGLRDLPSWRDGVRTGRLLAGWAALLGPEAAEHTRPVSLSGGTLLVSADTPAWAAAVRLREAEVLRLVAAGLGHGLVTRVEVGVGADRRAAPPPGGRSPAAGPWRRRRPRRAPRPRPGDPT